jgi:serine/threonine protein kinase
LQLSDLKFLTTLGKGSSGVVQKALHVPSNEVFAVKVIFKRNLTIFNLRKQVIPLELKENVRKQIVLELKTLHKTQCEQVVTFFDAFYEEGSIFIALEYMDAGSLGHVIEKSGPIPEVILVKIAEQVFFSNDQPLFSC